MNPDLWLAILLKRLSIKSTAVSQQFNSYNEKSCNAQHNNGEIGRVNLYQV